MTISLAGTLSIFVFLLHAAVKRSFLGAMYLSISAYTLGFINFTSNGIGVEYFILIIWISLFLLLTINRMKIKIGNLEWTWLAIVIVSFLWHSLVNEQIILTEFNTKLSGAMSITEINTFSFSFLLKSTSIIFYVLTILSMRYLLKDAESKDVLMLLLNICTFLSVTAILDLFLPTDFIWSVLKDHASFPVEIGAVIAASGALRITGLTVEPSHLVVFSGIGIIGSVVLWYSKLYAKAMLYLGLNLSAFFFSGSLSIVFFLFSIFLLIIKLSSNGKLGILYGVIIVFIIIAFQLENLIANILIKLDISNIENSLRLNSMLQAVLLSFEYPLFGVGLGNVKLPLGFILYTAASLGWISCILLLSVYCRLLLKAFKASTTNYDFGIVATSLSIFLMCLFTKGAQFIFSPYITILFCSIFVVMDKKHQQEFS